MSYVHPFDYLFFSVSTPSNGDEAPTHVQDDASHGPQEAREGLSPGPEQQYAYDPLDHPLSEALFMFAVPHSLVLEADEPQPPAPVDRPLPLPLTSEPHGEQDAARSPSPTPFPPLDAWSSPAGVQYVDDQLEGDADDEKLDEIVEEMELHESVEGIEFHEDVEVTQVDEDVEVAESNDDLDEVDAEGEVEVIDSATPPQAEPAEEGSSRKPPYPTEYLQSNIIDPSVRYSCGAMVTVKEKGKTTRRPCGLTFARSEITAARTHFRTHYQKRKGIITCRWHKCSFKGRVGYVDRHLEEHFEIKYRCPHWPACAKDKQPRSRRGGGSYRRSDLVGRHLSESCPIEAKIRNGEGSVDQQPVAGSSTAPALRSARPAAPTQAQAGPGPSTMETRALRLAENKPAAGSSRGRKRSKEEFEEEEKENFEEEDDDAEDDSEDDYDPKASKRKGKQRQSARKGKEPKRKKRKY